jgi:outer membrane PBP1 activator LpoA protein
MTHTPWMIRSAALLAACFALAGCPSLGPRAEAPPSVDRARTLERSGDQAGAARIYEALADQNSGTEKNAMLLLAARAYINARKPDDAQRVLSAVAAPTTPEQNFERQMLGADLALARDQAAQAWQQLSAIPEPTVAPAAPRYLELKQRAAFATGRAAEAVRAEIARERFLLNAEERNAARVDLLLALRGASERGLRIEPRSANDPVIRGWLELASLAAAAARSPTTATPDVEAWRTRYPNHPANDAVRTELLGLRPEAVERVAHVALLLPLSGRQATAANTVRDGFMTAYYQGPASQRPRLRVYDTSSVSASEAIARAQDAGAEMIVGPLLREEVMAAADLGPSRTPLLALNYLPSDRAPPTGFYQFALSPEEEARQVARRVLAEGRRRGIAIVPQGDWGTRVLAAFTQELETGGGVVLSNVALDTTQTDYAPELTQVLRISDSRARQRRLESILGTKLQMEPRRRADIDFIFAPSPAPMARLLRPQLRFHFAGDIPTYATSDAFEPDPSANEDMEGLQFPDMPWMLGGEPGDSVRAAAREAWPSGGPRRNRLFAFGYDAYRMAVALRGNPSGSTAVEGLTGRLTIDGERRVHRELAWAQMKAGVAKPVTPQSP